MKRLDSDLLGILLALLTFVLPAVSAFLEKRRKEKRRGRARMPHAESSDPYPDKESPIDAEEMQVHATRQEIPSVDGDEPDAPLHIQEEDVRAREIEELFEVLLGGPKKSVEEEPAVQETEVPVAQEDGNREQALHGMETALTGHEEPFEEGACAVEPQLVQRPVAEPEAGVPAARKSLKDRLKEHPEDMVLFAEIMKPKFKEF